jgi:hypothetical protein
MVLDAFLFHPFNHQTSEWPLIIETFNPEWPNRL